MESSCRFSDRSTDRFECFDQFVPILDCILSMLLFVHYDRVRGACSDEDIQARLVSIQDKPNLYDYDVVGRMYSVVTEIPGFVNE